MNSRRTSHQRMRADRRRSRERSSGPNVLVLSLGMTPQVVTETLWVLLRREPPFLPEEIHLLTTGLGAETIARELLGRDGGPNRLEELAREFGVTLPMPEIHAIEEEDIRSGASSSAFGDLVVEVVRDITTRHPNARIHASLAGGRKTMSFYMGYTLSLFGGLEDELSHVLVSPPAFENSREFWWKYREPRTIRGFDPVERCEVRLSTADANIDLAPIPFLPLRQVGNRGLLARPDVGFEDVVALKRMAITGPILTFDDENCSIDIGGHLTVTLPSLNYSLYRLLAEVRREDRPGVGPGGRARGEAGWLDWQAFCEPSGPEGRFEIMERFLEICDRAQGRMNSYLGYQKILEKLRQSLHMEKPKAIAQRARVEQEEIRPRLRPALTRLRGALEAQIGDPHLLAFLQVRERKDDHAVIAFGLGGMDPGHIRFRDDPP